MAIEGHQSLYFPSGILDDMLDLEEEDRCCLLTDLMDEAEDAWKTVLKRQTIASLADEVQAEHFQEQVAILQELIHKKMVL